MKENELEIIQNLISYFQEQKTSYEDESKKTNNEVSKAFFDGVAFGYQCTLESLQNQIDIFKED